MSAGSELSIAFRTTKRSGLLFYATSQNGSQRMVIEQVKGQVRHSCEQGRNWSVNSRRKGGVYLHIL